MLPESLPVGDAGRHPDAGRPRSARTDRAGFVVGIIGGGAFCTYAVERLAAEASARPPSRGMDVHIFNRTPRFGAGMAQDSDQSPTSVMNRVASQIALAADESNSGARNLLPEGQRPTFLEWSRRRHEQCRQDRYDLKPEDMPARQVHGEALRQAFDRYAELLRSVDGVRVTLHVGDVRDIRALPGDRLAVLADRASPIEVDALLLVTGHPDNAPREGSRAEAFARASDACSAIRFIDQIYPLDGRLTPDAVPAGESVGLVGMGLAAIDAILHLTEGRGGRFEPDDRGHMRYRRSGREPSVIVPTAPSGLFPGTRPLNMKSFDPTGLEHSRLEHRPRFMTPDAIEQLRRTAGIRSWVSCGPVLQLDFERHVFPLLVLEMGYVYYLVAAGGCGDLFAESAGPGYASFLKWAASASPPSIDDLLEPMHRLAARHGLRRFCWRALFDPIPLQERGAPVDWRQLLLDHLRADLAAAERGNLRDPVKAACDGVWRDLRSVLSQVVDFGGLTASSQRQFMGVYWRHYCRMSNGAGVETMRKILALCEEGIVDISIGPQPGIEPDAAAGAFRITGGVTAVERRVRAVADARVHDFDVHADRNPLYRNLLAQGLVRLWRNRGVAGADDFLPGSLDVTRDFEAVRADGRVEPRISILGAPIEGTAFFQLAAARPQSNSPILNACGRWAGRMVAMAAAGSAPAKDPAQDTRALRADG